VSDTTNPQDPPGPALSDDPYLVVERSPEFRDLRTRYRRFIFPMGALFMAWYLLLIYCAGWRREWMGQEVVGSITVGYIFALLQFVSTFAIAAIYTRYADTRIDPVGARLKAEVERLDAARGAHPTHTSDADLEAADLSTGA
jgi:uncharacterized membrane protein (DUF485 family)